MYINRHLFEELDGYEAYLYSAIKSLILPEEKGFMQSNEFLMGAINEPCVHCLEIRLEGLIRNGYIEITTKDGDRIIYLKKFPEPQKKEHCLKIDILRDISWLKPLMKVWLSYILEELKTEKRVKVDNTLFLLDVPTDGEFNEEFKEAFQWIRSYGIGITDDGYLISIHSLVNPTS